jgi:hypothetical protein
MDPHQSVLGSSSRNVHRFVMNHVADPTASHMTASSSHMCVMANHLFRVMNHRVVVRSRLGLGWSCLRAHQSQCKGPDRSYDA